MEDNNPNIIYRKTKLVTSKNNTQYRRLYYANEEVEQIPENVLPKQEVKNHYIKTVSKNGKTYCKHPPDLYKELHTKNYEQNKDKICRRIFIKNLKTARRSPHDASILFYKLSEQEVEAIRDERIKDLDDEKIKESLGELYNKIIERISIVNSNN